MRKGVLIIFCCLVVLMASNWIGLADGPVMPIEDSSSPGGLETDQGPDLPTEDSVIDLNVTNNGGPSVPVED